MQILDPWEYKFHEWMKERKESFYNANRAIEDHNKLIEFDKIEEKEIEDAKRKDIYHILGVMYERKRIILIVILFLIMIFVYLLLI